MLFIPRFAFFLAFLLCPQIKANGLVELRINLFPAGSFVAKSTKVTGHAEQKGSSVTAKNITVDTNSFDSGIELRNKHMKQRFESDKYPEAILLEAHGEGGKGKGKLKVRDVTQDVEGTYKIEGDQVLEATFKTKASLFGIKDVSYMKVGMEDELEVFVRVPLKKASNEAPVEDVKKKTTKKK
jgi:hypothetical protein